MADTDTKTVSLGLYRYLCQNIVETESYVKTIRQLNNVRDNVMGSKDIATITSGSFGEGLELRGSDLDMMDVATLIEVYADEKPRLNPNITYYKMVTDDIKPGFTQLLLEKNDNNYLLQYCEELNGKHYLSSALFKRKQAFDLDKYMIHGPCISDKAGLFDYASCLHCRTWISQASQWISRSSNLWPSYNVKKCIIKHGVLCVPIGVKGSSKEDMEWRISFSVGEKMLINTFTHAQLLCYALLKIVLKDVIETYAECSDLLCSNFLKTIIFWLSEELPQTVWKPDNLIPSFMRCFSRLVYCVEYSTCLHYFIPENNMFENRIEGRAREILLDKLYSLHSYGWRCVLFSDQLSKFHVSVWMDHIEPHTLRTIEIAKTMHSKLLSLAEGMHVVDLKMENYIYKRKLDIIVASDQSSLKYFTTYFISLWCSHFAQCFSLNIPRSSNKNHYKQYHSCCCTLLQNIYHDAVSGWLMLATFFYKSKQYSKALYVIEYSLSKCTPEKLYKFMDMLDIHYRLYKLTSEHKKCIVQLWKIMLVDVIKFEKNSLMIPDELHMELENLNCNISSIVYGYFLKFLCHYHLNNVRQCQDCLQTLQHVIAENYCIENEICLQSRAYIILGIALQMSEDHKSARQAFMRSVKICPDHRFNTSFKRLSLMSSL